VIQEIGRSIPLFWKRAVLVIIPTECEKESQAFVLALYNPEHLGRFDVLSLTQEARPSEGVHEAVRELLAVLPSMQIPSIRFGIVNTWRLPSGRLTGLATYEYLPSTGPETYKPDF
jgi:hypothetical protein